MTEPRPIRSVAGSPDVVLGITEWRGQLLTVIDLPAILEDGPGTGPACLVRLAEPFESTALFVPAAVRLQRIGTPIAPVTSGNGTTGSRGTIDLDGRRLVVLAAAPLMAAVEES